MKRASNARPYETPIFPCPAKKTVAIATVFFYTICLKRYLTDIGAERAKFLYDILIAALDGMNV